VKYSNPLNIIISSQERIIRKCVCVRERGREERGEREGERVREGRERERGRERGEREGERELRVNEGKK
jgi:hypothetical protein